MIAIFENGGKQYKVQVGDVITLEKLDKKEGDTFEIKKVLLAFDDKKTEVGTPFASKTVKVKVLENGDGDKVRVFKMKSKKRYSRTYGHRQPYSKVEVVAIN